MSTATYDVVETSCGHCEPAVVSEVSAMSAVEAHAIGLKSKRVAVSGRNPDATAIRNAIPEAGHEEAA